MNLVLVTAILAVCGADKLDRTYLPPSSASTAGGSSGFLETPFKTFNQGLGSFPKGSYSNDFEGVVVDAAAPGTRASGADETGLGGPRIAYGSTDSKVGEAAFTADAAFPRVSINSGSKTQGGFSASPQNYETRPERVQSSRDRVSNIVTYENDVSPDKFNYAFQTDNGIVAEENGIEVNGVKAQGGFSYTGDDGQVYSVTYTADEDGYRPKGDHLPTPPPIPVEILESLKKNAQDEAAGIVDDGTYDAKKYNTGEDYIKTDNSQYNNGQPIQLGNRPQSDALASGSFNNQYNQGFVRPNSQQFGSTSLLGSPIITPSNGNSFGKPNNVINSVQNAQTFDFEVASNNEYLPPGNTFNANRRPSVNSLQGAQSDAQSKFPSISTFNVGSTLNKKQNTDTPAYVPLAQQNLQKDKPIPQSNSPIFGKPTIIDSTLSIKDPFAKRPSSNRFTQNNQSNPKPPTIGGTFEVVSGNVYSSKNEYLPPRRQSNKPNQNNGNQRLQGISASQPSGQFTNSQVFSSISPPTTAFGSGSPPSLGIQSSQYNNGQQPPQYTGNNLFNQIGQIPNGRPSNQKQALVSTNLPKVTNSNRSPVSQFQYRPSTFSSQSPTMQPQTELTTPLQTHSDQNKDAELNPLINGLDSLSSTSSSGLPSFGSQPSNSLPGQFNFNTNKLQQLSPTQASASTISTLSDESITTSFQNSPESGRPTSNFGFQSQNNKLGINRPYSFSTERPSLNQNNQQQGPDDSYYYNTPSKPFNTPAPRPQTSIFPSTSFDQPSKVTKTPFGNRPQLSNTPTAFFTSQSNTPIDATRYPKPSSLAPVSPTLPTQQDEQYGNTFPTQFNKVTQASTSSFPSPAPTTPTEPNGNQFDRFETRPLQLGKPQQQNSGEIYEYNKPSQRLPTPQNAPSSGQFGLTTQFGSTPSPSTTGKLQADGTYKPSSQFGTKYPQQPLGQRPPSGQDNQASNVNSPTQNPQEPGQFNVQSLKPNQNSQPVQGASKFPPTYNEQKVFPPCCKKIGTPATSTQSDEQDTTPQFSNQFKPNQDFSNEGTAQGTKPAQSVSTFAGVGESFGGPRKPPSFDSNGYHY